MAHSHDSSSPAKAGDPVTAALYGCPLMLRQVGMSRERSYWVYILANRIGGTLYIGVTNDLVRRVVEHRLKVAESFTKRHDAIRLVYFECFDEIEQAIRREKRLKKWTRSWKISLTEKDNPNWIDLYPEIA